jgi:disulfide bond formation protein DsbB
MSINLKNIHIIMIGASVISLLTAYLAEYIFLLAPCPLCLYQRFPYLIFIMLGLIGSAGQYSCRTYYITVTIIAIIIAFYHTGIERGIFELSSFCKPLVSVSKNISVADFKELLYSKEIALCNKPALVIFGLSMTEWNLLLNIVLLTILSMFKNQSKDS